MNNNTDDGLLLHTGLQLKAIRKKLNMTQRILSEKLKKPEAEISLIEQGKRNITLQSLQDMANILGFNAEVKFKKIRNGKTS